MNVLLNGILGYMGKEVAKLCESGYRGARLAMGVDPRAEGEDNIFKSFADVTSTDGVDCIVDFSHHSATSALLAFATENKLPVVVATTGHTDEEIAEISLLAKEKIAAYTFPQRLQWLAENWLSWRKF